MSDQENREVRIFFDSNRFPWERQYTDGKGNWYDRDQLNYDDENNNIFYLKYSEQLGWIESNLDSSEVVDNIHGDEDNDTITTIPRTSNIGDDRIPDRTTAPLPLRMRSFQLLNLGQVNKQYKYKNKTYNKNSLFYFKDKKNFYDPNSNKFYDTIRQSFNLYCRYDPIEPGPYDPTNPNKLHNVLNKITSSDIEIEMKTQNNTSYKLYVFAQFDSPSSFVNC